ncbi:MAG: 2-oxoacid:acceptor oxidoreductase family protein [Thermoplasmataceae archaeon]
MIQIRIGGWAGQGVMLAGTILAHSFSEVLKKNVVMTRSYTAAVRSGISTADVIIDDSAIYDLVITFPDVMIFMDQRALEASIGLARKSSYVIIDSTVVKKVPEDLKNVHVVDASAKAERISSPKISNMVLLGAFSRITGFVPMEALEETVKKYVPEKFAGADVECVRSGFASKS